MQRRQLAQQLGQDFDPSLLDDRLLRDAALGSLIDRMLLLQAAKGANFAFSREALDQLILQTPEFRVDGAFNPARFDQVIQQMGYSRLQFRQLLEQEMLIGQLRAGISGTGFVTDQQVQNFARLEMQTRFRYADRAGAARSHRGQRRPDQRVLRGQCRPFSYPEQVVVEYVELKKESFFDQVEASDEELQELYQKQIANLAEQRRAAHILIETGGELSDDEAKAKIDEIAARVKNGEDFAAVAKEVSGSGLGQRRWRLGLCWSRGVRPSIRRCALCIERRRGLGTGQVGVRLAHHQAARRPVTGGSLFRKHEAGAGTRAEGPAGRATLRGDQQTAGRRCLRGIRPAQPAQELGLMVQTTEAFGREGGEGITANRQVIRAAFSEEVLVDGANSSVIELDPDTAVVIRVKEHLKPAPIPLADVRDDIVQQLQRTLAAETARTQGEQLLAELREGKQPEGQWQAVEAATRSRRASHRRCCRQCSACRVRSSRTSPATRAWR